MSGLSGIDYHRMRADAELKRALQASDARAAALHRELAELHRQSADADDGTRPAGIYRAFR